MKIDEYSIMSIYIELYIEGGEKPIGIGTAFTVEKNKYNYLITNWHIVTGRNPDTNAPIDSLCDPDYLIAWFFTNEIGRWHQKKIFLKTEDGKKLWIEHHFGRYIDVVAIPFTPCSDINIRNLKLETANEELLMYPSRSVSIIGYPLGLSAGGKFPIWKNGHIASEFDLDFDNKPIFLIDATTRSGMSGSPVILRESGLIQRQNHSESGRCTKFLGVYSGRIDEKSEIGKVWKVSTVEDILDNAEKTRLFRLSTML